MSNCQERTYNNKHHRMVQNVTYLQEKHLYQKYQKNGPIKQKLYVAWIMRAHAHTHVFHTHPSGHFKA